MDKSVMQPYNYQQDGHFYQMEDGPSYNYVQLKSSPCHKEYPNSVECFEPYYSQSNSTDYMTTGSYYIPLSPNYSERVSSPSPTSGKVKRKRTKFTMEQLQTLEQAYLEHDYIPKLKRMQLAKSLGLPDVQVKVWFQNRRCKTKKENRQKGKSHVTSLTPQKVYDNIFHTMNQKHPNESFLDETINFADYPVFQFE